MIISSESLKAAERQLLATGGALWGAACAIAGAPFWKRPSSPAQLPGLMTSQGLDSNGPLFFVLTLIAAVATGAFALSLAHRLTETRSGRWGTIAVFLSCVLTWVVPFAMLGTTALLLALAIPCITITIVACTRGKSVRFGRRDLVLVPSMLVLYLALLEATAVSPLVLLATAVFITLGLRLLVEEEDERMPAALTFAPTLMLSLCEIPFCSGDHRLLAAIVVALWAGSIFSVRSIVRRRGARMVAPLAFVSLLVFSVVYPYVVLVPPLPVANLFEHGHNVLPASEMLRGERLYRDIIPIHGLLADGAIDYAALVVDESLGSVFRFRLLFSLINPLAIFLATFALTGSPEAGALASVALSSIQPTRVIWLRSAPSLLAAAIAALAVRRRSTRLLVLSGALAGVAFFTSIDFGAYALASVLVAAFRFSSDSRRRLAAIGSALLGTACVAVIALASLATRGIAGAFLRTTFVELREWMGAYSVGFFRPEQCCDQFLGFPEILVAPLVNPLAFSYVGWVLVAAAAAARLVVQPVGSSRRWDPFMVLAGWTVASAAAYAERLNVHAALYWVIAIGAAGALFVKRSRFAAALAASVALLIACHPMPHLVGRLPSVRATPSEALHGFVEIPIPRARGAVFAVRDVTGLPETRAFLGTLAPGDTFFDFVNLPILYYLFERPCPVRQVEVPLMESVARQREVIAALEADRSVRAVLVGYPYWSHAIDDVPNRTRAPLIWNYIQTHFRPEFEENGVVFWTRIDK